MATLQSLPIGRARTFRELDNSAIIGQLMLGANFDQGYKTEGDDIHWLETIGNSHLSSLLTCQPSVQQFEVVKNNIVRSLLPNTTYYCSHYTAFTFIRPQQQQKRYYTAIIRPFGVYNIQDSRCESNHHFNYSQLDGLFKWESNGKCDSNHFSSVSSSLKLQELQIAAAHTSHTQMAINVRP